MGLTSAHWGTYHAEVEDGRLKDMRPFEADLDPNEIGRGIIEVVDDKTRIIQPMVRKSWLSDGPGSKTDLRGKEPFVPVNWTTATKLVARELQRVKESNGNEAIYAGSYGWASAGRFHHAQSQIHRFLNKIGGYTRSVNTYSFAAAEVIVPHVIGHFREYIYNQTSWSSIQKNCELFVAFGGVPLKNGQIGQGGLGSHIQRDSILNAYNDGVRFYSVSPLRTDMIGKVNAEWCKIRPNTDTALILAICYVLLEEGLLNQDFLENYCVGFEKFASYLRGFKDSIKKTPEWAENICAVSAEEIRKLARRMANSRTMLSFSWSLTRQAFGEQPLWAGITLACMLGQIGLPGGGFGIGYSAVNTIGGDLCRIPVASVPQGKNPVDSFIPVARIADMLLNPGKTFEYNGGSQPFPDIKIVYWAGGNPFHHHQDLNRLLLAWQRPETVIVHEWCWNALAKHADIVLPVTTTLERRDIAMSPIDNYFVSMEPAIAPVGEARDDYRILAEVAQLMGVEEKFTEGRDEEDWQRWLYEVTKQTAAKEGHELPSYDAFRAKGWFMLPTPKKPNVLLSDFRADPVKNHLLTPSGKIEIYSETIESYGYDDCAPHPCWYEPQEWLGSPDLGTKLHLLGNQPKSRLHSQLDHGAVSRATKIAGHEPVTINPIDAKIRGIKHGDIVQLSNSRGACLCGANVSDEVMSGVLVVSTGAWFDPDYNQASNISCKHGNPNVLTPDLGTSKLAQGPAAHSCLVEIEKWCGNSLAVTAFEPPAIEKSGISS